MFKLLLCKFLLIFTIGYNGDERMINKNQVVSSRLDKLLVSSNISESTYDRLLRLSQKLNELEDQIYTVQSGDSLSALAKKFYGDINLWPVLVSANKISNPDLIQVGQKLNIPSKRSLSPEEGIYLQEYKQKKKEVKPDTHKHEVSLDSKTKPHQDHQYHQQMIKNPLLREAEIERLGLVDLSEIPGVIAKHSYSKHAHPRFVDAMQEALKLPYIERLRVTEAFPATVKHKTRAHYNGQAIDLTISNPKYADQLCDFFKKRGFSCLNEYKYDTEYKTGGHIHLHFY